MYFIYVLNMASILFKCIYIQIYTFNFVINIVILKLNMMV